MLPLKKDKKEEEEGGGNPFNNLEKSSVLQEARTFNETPINPRKCGHILTKVLYIINQGESIGQTEATEAFFAMTKLFQSKDPILRRLVYLGIKEMSKIAQDVIIVTSSLMKDMTGKEDQFRGPAIRALCSVTDHSMLQSIERYMKQAIVDKVPGVSSAALVSALHLGKDSQEVIKRWVNEAQEAVNSDNVMVQFHALGLLYYIRKTDKLAVNKLVSKFSKHTLKSPYAYCLLIRIASKLIEEEDAGSESPMFDFIESCLRHKSEMVIYEAAHAIVQLKNTTAKDLAPAVSVLQLFCSSPKPTLRFAAVRTLNKVAIKHPAAVTACSLDLENLQTDVNRSIATLAITTLLKTGNESSVDRHMKQISSFMSEISDEFKIVVVQAIRSVCVKFPRKHNVLMTYLAQMLRDEGTFDYKREIVDCIIVTIEENPEAKEVGLAHLCEFIEDCEHTVLATKILHLLGKEGPRTPTPSKYIRFIYNRVILENAAVRAAAVSAIAKFGAHCDDLLDSCIVLLERCQLDTDDEVRDRATFYVNVLKQQQKSLSSAFILNGLQVSVVGLEWALHQYTLEPSETEFDMKSVPLATQPLMEQEVRDVPGEAPSARPAQEKVAASRQDVYQEQLAQVPELANLGLLFKSSQPMEVTESETEYYIQCVKHTFSNYLVFQFDCTNTLNDQLLEKVTVEIEPAEGFEVTKYIPCPSLPYNKPGTTYTLVRLPAEPTQVTGTFACTLKFLVKDCDPQTGEPDDEGYDDEYVLEDVEVSVADHVQRVMKPNFAASWEEVGPENELEDTYSLSTMSTIEEAIKNIVQYIGLQPCERSDKVPEGKSSHTLYLAGVFRGGHDALVRAKLALDSSGVTMQLTVRSTDPSVSEVLATAVA
ncbi:coatomer subunit gamma [Plakobranchus ocellatus]|uniref:Coatomer subunit gamma n=1 Tax=Plakobranchus ocellatus TaxID=259542 RepID=A0AAV3Z0M2_9GAST|nr:coatomer subunit gamma [Plakobranchus ocellatus]